MTPGDKIIPFLMDWRIGPVGTIRALHVKDSEWKPSVPAGVYEAGEGECRHVSKVPELGRRIEVEWESGSMPPDGKVARVRGRGGAVARSTIEKRTSAKAILDLLAVLKDPTSWENVQGH